MDTKLKKYNTGLTVLIFVLCIVLFITSLMGIAIILNKSSELEHLADIDDLLLNDSYQNSKMFQWDVSDKVNNIVYLLNEYKSEEYIRNGMTLSEDYAKETEKNKERLILEELRYFREIAKELDKEQGFTYFASDGTHILTNMRDIGDGKYVKPENFTGKPAYLIFQNDKLNVKLSDKSNESNAFIQKLEARIAREYNPELRVYLSFDQEYLAEHEEAFSLVRRDIFKWLPYTIASIILTLAAFIFLVTTTGRRDEEGNRQVYKIDKIFTEIQLIIIAFCFFGGGVLFVQFLFDAIYNLNLNGAVYYYGGSFTLSMTIAVIIGLTAAGIGLLFILSCVRNIKAGRFIKNSLIYIVAAAIIKGLMSLYHGGSVMRKTVLITLVICILSATVVLAPIVAILIIILAPKWVKKYEEIKKGVDEVKNGNLTYKIPLSGNGELDELAKGINEISEASNIAIQNELKNQRLKTDLISNVSHDLKTPLTSIITYIDLLKREGLDSTDAPKYLEILDQKSIRLKKLTEDLFDAAKASSGAIPVRFEKVEMLSLINQGLGEMNNQIEASRLNFIINAQKTQYYVKADGQLLWRVLENLLGNVLKYALEGSRVYIDIKEQNARQGKTPNVILEIKNISKSELNIDADELMERFKRGDESRTTEGSGLGLAIAKDLVRLQNGWFEIKIDGDLFKASIMLEAYEEENEGI
ncbi:MAG TPA: HAMP domain-containing histidine kinase [Clostridiales bacterium]|nr:HAMP domain-containing histidine kinase [Clostridiales bacterium]